jgi:hypothetical protein
VHTPDSIDRANHYHAYMKGWRHGGAGRAMDPGHRNHENEDLRAAYSKGYSDGYVARSNAAVAAQVTYGHTPTLLRTCDDVGGPRTE